MFRIVQATKTVIETLGEPPVVVGGLAVMCRLQTAHRATLDLDVVDRGLQDQTHLEVLRRVEGASDIDPSAVLLPTLAGEVKVDVLEVNQAEIDHPSDDPGDRLHATSHAWAYDTATSVRISAYALEGESIEVVTLVSEPGPLVAMKLQAIMNRTTDKEGTDLLDIVRLTLDGDCRRSAIAQIQGRPAQMKDDIRQHSNHWFVDRRSWSLERIRSAGGDVDADDLDLVHEVLADAASA
ncbi:nucleotidyl transferase AbiEii/AbiGii toxin family protein [Nocardioides sp. KIGAM211]|uniref:Nucleotidyl transferase AbiEii/AbiGii toxin family protein n=2 Tax=Nocardioides luti TaxID=2761101 RepID=A0A7X0RHL3_9ACTN|nr:nucleotidyl transferase AbiEii/AbiGii toxin family protein [Nocardioides luti]